MPDCTHGEDESPSMCQCKSEEFQCKITGCVDKLRVCDGVPNCADGSDEWNCVSMDPSVEVLDYANDAWLPVCADHWTSEHSDRVCRQFGHRKAVEHRAVPLSLATENQSVSEVFLLNSDVPPLHSDDVKLQFLVNKRPSSECTSGQSMRVFCESYDCGVWHPSEDAPIFRSRAKRVVGGHVSGKHQWPSTVVMLHTTNEFRACTASIIAPYWILTSALCVRKTNALNWKIVAGNGQPNKTDPEMLVRSVQRFVAHPSYKFVSGLADFDVMLVRLNQPLDVSSGEPSPSRTKSRVGAICLPNQPISEDAWCVTAGWGYTTPGGYFINKQLRHLEMKIVDQETCNGTEHYRGKLSQQMACAINKHSQPCFNDEGAPLMCHDPGHGRWYLAGVLTTQSCDSQKHPAIFADTYSMLEWIQNTISG